MEKLMKNKSIFTPFSSNSKMGMLGLDIQVA